MRPFVTLTYAQSLDGSIALPGQRVLLSGRESQKFTHQLRASHDAILVGVGTVLVDDPQLTVRLVSGPNPQPIVLDSHLRIPITAALFKHPNKRPWLAATVPPVDRVVAVEAAGARVLRLPRDAAGEVALPALLDKLGEEGILRLMVEGGASVINAFLEQHLVNKLILTIAPKLLGGLKAVEKLSQASLLRNVNYHQVGEDLVVEADLE
jgi:3,4-dihydroxy 2-butanone 4-phosphate synthase/GTP cyclohydrolase II